jgi:hypothetical protein
MLGALLSNRAPADQIILEDYAMRNLIVSSLFAAAFLVAGSAAWQANAAAFHKGSAPVVTGQAQGVKCYWHAPNDGCGWGRWRTRRGYCRPC